MEMSESFLEQLLDAIPDGVVLLHENRILQVNAEFSRLFGYPAAGCIGQDIDGLVMPDGRLYESDIILHSLRSTGKCAIDTVRRTAAGALVDVSVLCSQVRLGPAADGMLVMYRDVSRQRREEARLRHSTLHDALTGLANRTLFMDRVRLTMARLKRRPDRGFAVMFLDLDGFKKVNDTLGHSAGDAVLLEVAERLSRCLRPQDTVARFGGDEFAILLDESTGPAHALQVADRVQLDIQRPVEIPGAPNRNGSRVSASIGIALAHSTGPHVERLLEQADEAMYAAKAAGKARAVLFGSEPLRVDEAA